MECLQPSRVSPCIGACSPHVCVCVCVGYSDHSRCSQYHALGKMAVAPFGQGWDDSGTHSSTTPRQVNLEVTRYAYGNIDSSGRNFSIHGERVTGWLCGVCTHAAYCGMHICTCGLLRTNRLQIFIRVPHVHMIFCLPLV